MEPEFNDGDNEDNPEQQDNPEERLQSQAKYMLLESIKLIQRNELGRQGRNRFKHN